MAEEDQIPLSAVQHEVEHEDARATSPLVPASVKVVWRVCVAFEGRNTWERVLTSSDEGPITSVVSEVLGWPGVVGIKKSQVFIHTIPVSDQ